jgi:hypothetical protein
LQGLAEEAATHFDRHLRTALERYESVVVVTHVPPFRRACRYRGKISDDHILPHYSSKIAGEVMVENMRAHPDQQLVVLCGHTHGAGNVKILPNLRVLTGESDYGAPRVQRAFSVE